MRTTLFSLTALVTLALAPGCGEPPKLSPARDILGTWRTAFPDTFYAETDWCDGTTMQLMLTQKRVITWDITDDSASGDDNAVSITQNWTDSDTTYVQLCLNDTGVTPDVRPMFLKGTINGAYLTVKKGAEVFGEFSFTTSNMEGNWSARSCPFACQRIYTVEREFKMNKVD